MVDIRGTQGSDYDVHSPVECDAVYLNRNLPTLKKNQVSRLQVYN